MKQILCLLILLLSVIACDQTEITETRKTTDSGAAVKQSSIEKPIRINKDSVEKNNIVSTYEYKPLYPTVGVSEDDYEKKLSDNPYWPYYDGYDLRMRINDASTDESIVYKAAKNVQLHINDKTALRNWGNVFDKYEPLLGEYRFYAIMMIGYKDGIDGRN